MTKQIDKQIREVAEQEAMETILSDLGGLSVDEIVEAWQNDKMPDEISLWQPFEYYDSNNALEVWGGFADQFERLMIESRKL